MYENLYYSLVVLLNWTLITLLCLFCNHQYQWKNQTWRGLLDVYASYISIINGETPHLRYIILKVKWSDQLLCVPISITRKWGSFLSSQIFSIVFHKLWMKYVEASMLWGRLQQNYLACLIERVDSISLLVLSISIDFENFWNNPIQYSICEKSLDKQQKQRKRRKIESTMDLKIPWMWNLSHTTSFFWKCEKLYSFQNWPQFKFWEHLKQKSKYPPPSQ